LDSPFPAYKGDEPYVFVCYAHDDKGDVYPEMTWLHEQGVNLWYDEGITPGGDWNEELGHSIHSASHVIFFVSPSSVASRHCRNEIFFAQDHEIPIVAVHLTRTDLPKGLQLMMATTQAILKHNVATPTYREKLLSALSAQPSGVVSRAMTQEVRFCESPDGVTIAYSTVGQGPPLVKAGNWLNHLEFDWESPVWRHVFKALSSDHTLVRYDPRGNGLSDWNVDEISFEAYVRDLESVVDAAQVSRFPLLGISQGCATSIAYAVRHPERVSHLVLLGGFARGLFRMSGASVREHGTALITLVRQGWGQNNPALRQMFTSLFIPDGTPEQMAWFNELERITASPENAARILDVNFNIDVRDMLPEVSVPTLVLHAREDAVHRLTDGRELATRIPDARFVTLESRNHLLLDHEPAWDRFLREVRSFLAT
jgi:pimeloyl-ACP methyl ester carboxylesterase